MQALKKYPLATSLFLLTACVTINVYFPAAAAENAADRIIREVYGEDGSLDETQQRQGEPQSALPVPEEDFFTALLNFFIPAAKAQQPDINIATPGINQLKSRMKQRHNRLSPYYNSGAVGMESNGLITLRDATAVPLQERNTAKKLVADENRDRSQLYEEIARANGHPEWETDIRNTFARRWIDHAPAGWWYRDPQGNWHRK